MGKFGGLTCMFGCLHSQENDKPNPDEETHLKILLQNMSVLLGLCDVEIEPGAPTDWSTNKIGGIPVSKLGQRSQKQFVLILNLTKLLESMLLISSSTYILKSRSGFECHSTSNVTQLRIMPVDFSIDYIY